MFRKKKEFSQSSRPAADRQGNVAKLSFNAKIKGLNRCKSMPAISQPNKTKGIMKFASLDESLHNKYGTRSQETKQSEESVSSEERRNLNIRFKNIEIREYGRTVGDNPSCSSGPPVSISWDYDPKTKILTLDRYEETRPPRRTHMEMILPRTLRHNMLRKEWDVSQSQIASAVRNNIKVKNQRRTTVNNLSKSSKFEEAVEGTSRKLLSSLMIRKDTDKQVEKLEAQMKEAERARKQLLLDEEMYGEYEPQTTEGTVAVEDE